MIGTDIVTRLVHAKYVIYAKIVIVVAPLKLAAQNKVYLLKLVAPNQVALYARAILHVTSIVPFARSLVHNRVQHARCARTLVHSLVHLAQFVQNSVHNHARFVRNLVRSLAQFVQNLVHSLALFARNLVHNHAHRAQFVRNSVHSLAHHAQSARNSVLCRVHHTQRSDRNHVKNALYVQNSVHNHAPSARNLDHNHAKSVLYMIVAHVIQDVTNATKHAAILASVIHVIAAVKYHHFVIAAVKCHHFVIAAVIAPIAMPVRHHLRRLNRVDHATRAVKNLHINPTAPARVISVLHVIRVVKTATRVRHSRVHGWYHMITLQRGA